MVVGNQPLPLLGVFGGTFDPVHLGHLRMAEEVAEALSLAAVHFVPASVPPHRAQPVATADDRLRLVQAAIADNRRFVFDDREHHRAGPSYMVDTLADFRLEFPDHGLVLMLGMDAFNGLTRWHRWQELFSLAHVAVATRPGAEPEGDAAALMQKHSMTADTLASTAQGGIIKVEITRLDISATAIRDRLDRGGSVRYLVPDVLLPVLRAVPDYQGKA